MSCRLEWQSRELVPGGVQSPERCNFFRHQIVLGTYKKNEKMSADTLQVMTNTFPALQENFWWNPRSSTVVQVSKDKQAFLTSTQTRADLPMFPEPCRRGATSPWA